MRPSPMASFLSDLRYAVRRLARTPAFTLPAIATLALGVGANAALFATVNAVVFRPVRAVQLEHVYHVGLASRTWTLPARLPLAHFRALQQNVPDVVEAVDAQTSGPDGRVVAQIPGRAELVEAIGITGGHATVFRLRPQLGRFISADDDRAGAPVAVISDRIWREWFGGDRDVLERGVLRLDNETFQVVGVAPFGYRGTPGFGSANVDVWMPFSRGAGGTPVVSIRLREGAGQAAAAQRIKPAIAPAPLPSYLRDEPYTAVLRRATAQPTPVRRAGNALLWLSALVLLAACANFANILFTRGVHRTGEMAVRRSLGATSARIYHLVLAEALVLACVASALGLTIALGAVRLLNDAFPAFHDRASRVAIDLTPDYRVFLYAFVAGVVSALVVGALTAWHASRVPPMRAMAAGGATTTGIPHKRARLVLVGLQISAAIVLVMGAGLYAQQTRGAFEERITFDTRPIATARFDLSRHGYNESRARAFFGRILDDVRAIPGVEFAALSDGMPGGGAMGGEGVTFAAERLRAGTPSGRYADGSHRRANGLLFSASSGLLTTLGLALEEGREIDPRDQENAALVAIVSRNTATELWGEGNPLGQRLMLGNDGHWRTVVGVFANPATVKPFELGFRQSNVVIVPLEQRRQPPLTGYESGYDTRFRREMVIVLRSAEPRGHLDALRAAVAGIDQDVAVFDAATADDSMLSWVAPVRATRLVLALLALVATAISVTGVYGVMAFMVARRTREFGIRMALGASPRQVTRLVIDDALHVLLVGLLAGTLAATLGERLIDARVFRLLPNEVSTWAVVLPLFLTVGLAAAYVPARRAAGVAPIAALRHL